MSRVRSPFPAPLYNRARSGLIDALVAQLAEHILGKDEVTGSIPVKGSMNLTSVVVSLQAVSLSDCFMEASVDLVCHFFMCIGGMDVQSEV